MKKSHHALLPAFITATILLAGCKNVTQPSSRGGLVQANIEGSATVNFKASGGCSSVHADYFNVDPTFPGLHSIQISGLEGNMGLAVRIYFSGSFPASPFFQLGSIDNINNNSKPFGTGQYTPDVNNASMAYITDDNNTGNCTITNYDQTSQTLSGTFSFAAQAYTNGALMSGLQTTISGSFANVPINDDTDPNNPKCPCYGTQGGTLGGSGTGSGQGTSSVTYVNKAFTPISITVNGQTQTIAVGGSGVFNGQPGATATGTASTSGQTSTGTLVGNLVQWTISNTFPASGSASVDLNVGTNLFFLNIINKSTLAMDKVYVNYGLSDQTVDNITIPNDGKTYNIGYYNAYTNSNVRAENGNTYWFWQTLNLPFTQNQQTTVTGD